MFPMKLLFNNYFQSITFLVTYLNGQMSRNLTFFDETDIIINKFWSHSKIIKLKQKFSIKKKIGFKPFNSLKASLMIYLGMK